MEVDFFKNEFYRIMRRPRGRLLGVANSGLKLGRGAGLTAGPAALYGVYLAFKAVAIRLPYISPLENTSGLKRKFAITGEI